MQQSLVIFGLICVRGKVGQGNHMSIATLPFSKSSIFKTFFRLYKNKRLALSNSSGLKIIFEKLHFCDKLEVWMVCITIEIKLSIFNFLAHSVGRASLTSCVSCIFLFLCRRLHHHSRLVN